MTVNTPISGLPEDIAGSSNMEFPVNDNGVTRKVKLSTIAALLSSSLKIKGTWNALTNNPTLASGGVGGIASDCYVVTHSGNTSVDGVSSWVVGDRIVNVASAWIRVPNTDVFLTGSGAPSSTLGVNGNLYVDGVTNDLYINTGGAWSLIGSIQGAPGTITSNSALNVGSSTNNILTITPGLTPTDPIVLSQSGSGGVNVGTSSNSQAVVGGGPDGASLTLANMLIESANGIGFQTTATGYALPPGVNSILFDTRGGNISAYGSATVGGTLNVGGAKISQSGSTTTIDTGGYVASLTSTTPVAGGTGNVAGDRFYDAYGNLYTATTVVSGGVTVVALNSTSALFGSPPANPISLTSLASGSGVTANLTWTQCTSLTLNPTGNVTVANNLTINGQVTGTLNVANNVVMSGLPTSNTSLTAGTLWNNGGVLCVA